MSPAAADAVVALDVGGDTIKAGAFDAQGHLLHWTAVATQRSRGPDAVVDLIVATAGDVRDWIAANGHRPVAAGIAVPGQVDDDAGIAVSAGNIGWANVALRQIAQDRLGVPVALSHDVRAAALAEVRAGAGRHSALTVYVSAGTGLGAALVAGGVVHRGAGGTAAELGHLHPGLTDVPCSCGRIGCLETVVSIAGLEREYRRHTGQDVRAREVLERAGRGEAAAGHVVDGAARALAAALLACSLLFGPELFVVGGGLAAPGSPLVDLTRAELSDQFVWGVAPQVVRAALGPRAGCAGASLLAWDVVGQPVADARFPNLDRAVAEAPAG